MDLHLPGTAGPDGWPTPDCRCASCGRMRAAGRREEPLRVFLDGLPLAECAVTEVPGGYDVTAPSGGRLLVAAGPGDRPEPARPDSYDVVLLDLIGCPDHLGLLRRTGTVTTATRVMAVHVDHRISSPAELDRRLAWWTRPRPPVPYRVLLLGGARSGKSREAELRLAGEPSVTYLATGPLAPGDPEWTARVAAHRTRRPPWWSTAETPDLPGRLRTASGALLVDGIGSWLTAVFDELAAWDRPAAVRPRVAELIAAWRNTQAHVVAVSDEVGLSVVPATPSGRAFRDALGRLNQRLAAESEEVALVIAGRVMELSR